VPRICLWAIIDYQFYLTPTLALPLFLSGKRSACPTIISQIGQ
jgi:hypothetical protein